MDIGISKDHEVPNGFCSCSLVLKYVPLGNRVLRGDVNSKPLYVNNSINGFMCGVFKTWEMGCGFEESMHCKVWRVRCMYNFIIIFFCSPQMKVQKLLESESMSHDRKALGFFFFSFLCLLSSYELEDLFGHIFNLD